MDQEQSYLAYFYELMNHGLEPKDMVPYFQTRGATLQDVLEVAWMIANPGRGNEIDD